MARSQHTVSRMLLQGFSDDRNRVRVTSRSRPSHLLALNSASVVKDFYSFTDDAGELDDGIEQWMSTQVESTAAPLIRAARTGHAAAGADKATIALFVANGLVRTRTVRARIESVGKTLGPRMLEEALLEEAARLGIELTSHQRATLRAEAPSKWAREADSEEERRSHLRIVLRFTDALATQLARWDWSIAVSPTPVLVTSDAGIATLTPDDGWGGLLPEGSPVLLPVSPTHLLIGEPHALQPGPHELPRELADAVNREMARGAYDIVITHPAMPWSAELTLPRVAPDLRPKIVITQSNEPATDPAPFAPISNPTIRAAFDKLATHDIGY